MKKVYYNSRREVRVEAHWDRNSMTSVPAHTEWVETKESKQLKSTIKYIEMQMQKSEK